ncbi:hypothetical protein, partial [Helicobacter cholecystus]|uniref:hypothetical protein n=1 Tax=Helicobacter cholecystus TaxID=45498 RepID=UPI0027383D39
MASSLALALGVSVGNAQETCSTARQGENPVICNGSSSIATSNLTWTDSNGLLAPSYSNGSSQQVNTIYVGFNGSNNQTNYQADTKTYNILGKMTGSSNQGIVFQTKGKGLKTNITANLWQTTAMGNSNKITFDFSNVGEGYALEGDLLVGGNAAEVNDANQIKQNTFTGTFGGKGIKGDLFFNNIIKSSDLTFKNGAKIEGNIHIVTGTQNFTFEPKTSQGVSLSTSQEPHITGVIEMHSDNLTSTTTFKSDVYLRGGILLSSHTALVEGHSFVFQKEAKIEGQMAENAEHSSFQGGNYAIVAGRLNNNNKANLNLIFNSDATIGNVLSRTGGVITYTFQKSQNTAIRESVSNTNQTIKIDNIDTNRGKNILLLKNNNGATSALTINKITTSGGINSIAKESFENTSEISSMDSKVFTGTLQIKQGIIGNNGGWTNIAFKAQNGSQTNSVISAGDNGNAIEGNANIYLDLSEANLNNQAIIDGNINGTGSMYLTLKGKNSSNSVGIQGNITTGQYTTKITLVDAGIQGKASQKAQEATGSNISVTQSSGKNIILATTSTNLNLGSITALSGGVNSIAKADLSSINNNGFTFSPASTHSNKAQVRGVQRVDAQASQADSQTTQDTDIGSKAMVGVLQIKNGVSANNGGWNNIAFRAGVGQSSPVIQKLKEVTPAEEEAELNQRVAHFIASDGKTLELDTAVSGNANLYLDMSSASSVGQVPNQPSAFFANLADNVSLDPLSKSIILGHLDNLQGGRQNIYIKGKGDNAGLTLGLTGNITNGNNGSMNIIFEDSLWTPYAVLKGGSGSATNAGGVVTTNGNSAKTNLILRKSPSS